MRPDTTTRWAILAGLASSLLFAFHYVAAKAGVSEKAIRLRACNPRQEGGPWQRDGRTPGRQGRRMVTVRTLRGSAEGRALLQAPIEAREQAEERRRIAASPGSVCSATKVRRSPAITSSPASWST